MRWQIIIGLFAAIVLNVASSAPVEYNSKFVLYRGQISTESYSIEDGVKILDDPNFDKSKKTVIYVHGYIETALSESVLTIVNAYAQRNDYNFVLLNWSDAASENYFNVALPYSLKLANAASKAILDMVDAGLDVSKLHLVGHSMGGQIVGRIGSEVKRRSGNKVVLKRISALDPAFPGYYGPLAKHISADDAEFVDVIHTDAWLYGAPRSTGTVDFWPNHGQSLQPGCPRRNYEPLTENDLCSHWRSWRFWAESVASLSSQRFNAVSASSWNDFVRGNTDKYDSSVVMGNDAPSGITGDYYLQTNARTPYARGNAGVVYDPSIPTSNVRVPVPQNYLQ